MLINYFGHSYFLIEGNDYSIALDPFKNVGLIEREVSAAYVFKSHDHYDHNNLSLVKGAVEITKSDERFTIIKTYHDEVLGAKRGTNNVLKFILDGKVLAFLGDIGIVDDNVVKLVKNCDYLFIPVGGTYTVDAAAAKKLVDKINPKCVIPMHYKVGDSTVDVSSVNSFLNLFDSYDKVSNPYRTVDDDKGVYLIDF